MVQDKGAAIDDNEKSPTFDNPEVFLSDVSDPRCLEKTRKLLKEYEASKQRTDGDDEKQRGSAATRNEQLEHTTGESNILSEDKIETSAKEELCDNDEMASTFDDPEIFCSNIYDSDSLAKTERFLEKYERGKRGLNDVVEDCKEEEAQQVLEHQEHSKVRALGLRQPSVETIYRPGAHRMRGVDWSIVDVDDDDDETDLSNNMNRDEEGDAQPFHRNDDETPVPLAQTSTDIVSDENEHQVLEHQEHSSVRTLGLRQPSVETICRPGAHRIRGVDWSGVDDDDEETYLSNNMNRGTAFSEEACATTEIPDPDVTNGVVMRYSTSAWNKLKERCKVICIFVAVGLIVSIAIGLGVGFGLKSKNDNNDKKETFDLPLVDTQTSALIECYNSWTKNNPTQWKNQTGWMTENSVCSWYGITCDDSGNITGLNLAYNQLVGTIPRQLTLLSQLIDLDLSFNAITGTIPTELGRLSNLVNFAVCDNEISGIIPTEIGQMSSLMALYLWSNQLSGNVPSEIGYLTSVQNISLYINQLTGALPTNIGACTELQRFYVYMNEMTGTIPSEIIRLPNIEELSFYDNMFTGNLSTIIGLSSSTSKLRYLSLSSNEMTGTIPSEISLLSKIEELWLFNNVFTGSLPTTIGLSSELRILSLDMNKMTGTIPSEIGLLSSIEEISFYRNKYVGSLPSIIRNLQNLTFLDLSSNQMNGSIPSAVGTWASLKTLRLVSNYFTGSIPTEIGCLQALEYLNIAWNRISGLIPSHLGNCQNLTHLDISSNSKLKGTVPRELGNLSNLTKFIFYETGLTGTMPNEICSLRDRNLTMLWTICERFPCDCCTECIY